MSPASTDDAKGEMRRAQPLSDEKPSASQASCEALVRAGSPTFGEDGRAEPILTPPPKQEFLVVFSFSSLWF